MCVSRVVRVKSTRYVLLAARNKQEKKDPSENSTLISNFVYKAMQSSETNKEATNFYRLLKPFLGMIEDDDHEDLSLSLRRLAVLTRPCLTFFLVSCSDVFQ